MINPCGGEPPRRRGKPKPKGKFLGWEIYRSAAEADEFKEAYRQQHPEHEVRSYTRSIRANGEYFFLWVVIARERVPK